MNKAPSYYAVIFSNQHTGNDMAAYREMADRMETLAKTMPGYLGFESARNDDGSGIAVSYWSSEEAISRWKHAASHLDAQTEGRKKWYTDYHVRVAKVEREYAMDRRKDDDIDAPDSR